MNEYYIARTNDSYRFEQYQGENKPYRIDYSDYIEGNIVDIDVVYEEIVVNYEYYNKVLTIVVDTNNAIIGKVYRIDIIVTDDLGYKYKTIIEIKVIG